MSETVPSRDDADSDKSELEDEEVRVMGVDNDNAEDLMSALSSDTARKILSEIHQEEGTATEISERLETSVQNIQYHLGKLDDAGLIQVVDTEYSPKGREMKVYAPADQPLLVFVGREEDKPSLQDALKSILGVFAFLGALSLAVQYLVADVLGPSGSSGGKEGGGIGIQSVEGSSESAKSALEMFPPGLLFFAGGAVIIAIGAVWWYWRSRE